MNIEDTPLGLVPDKVIARALGWQPLKVKVTRTALGIPAFSNGNEDNRGYPYTPGSFSALIAAWGVERAAAWVELYQPKMLDVFRAEVEGRSPSRRQKLDAQRAQLDGQPLGMLPDSIIGKVFGIPRPVVSKVRAERGVGPFTVNGDSMFPHRRDSFAKLIGGLGVDGAREWLRRYLPALLDLFEARLAIPAKLTGSGPEEGLLIPSTSSGSVPPSRAAEGRQKAILQTTGTSTQRDAALQRRPFIIPKYFDETSDEKIDERLRIQREMDAFLERGGRVTRLAGTGSRDLGRVIVCEENGGMDEC